jgi:hypothetical protein
LRDHRGSLQPVMKRRVAMEMRKSLRMK